MTSVGNVYSGYTTLEISTLLSKVYQNSSTSVPSALAADPMAAANARVASEIASTNVRLSAYSQIQSSLVSLQPAAATLSGLTSTATPASAVGAAQTFATAYNNAFTLTRSSIGSTGSLATDTRAQALSRDLKSILANVSSTTLSTMGISVNASTGTIAIDAAKLQTAMKANSAGVTSTLAKIGALAGQVAGNELAATGNVGASVTMLNSQSTSLTAQLALQQSYSSPAQTLSGSIISAYQKVGLM